MAFQHTTLLQRDVPPEQWRADRKLWLTRDGEVVEDGDPAAAVLFATKDYLVPRAEAERLGLVEPKSKKGDKPRDKQRQGPERDKGDGPSGDDPPADDTGTETEPPAGDPEPSAPADYTGPEWKQPQLKAELDKRGIDYPAVVRNDKLRELLVADDAKEG